MTDDRELTGDRPDRSADEEAERLASGHDPVASSSRLGGQASSASGGYGTGSDVHSSAGTGEGDEATSTAGDDVQTDWLRDAPGSRGDR